MIKTLHFLILLVLLSFVLSAQNIESEIIKENKLIIQKTNFRQDGRISEQNVMVGEDKWYEEVNVYKDSFLISSSHYLDGLNIANYFYSYNEHRLLSERVEKHGDSIVGVTYFYYNTQQQLINERIITGGLESIAINYEYCENGKLSARTEKISDTDIDIYNSEFFEYNSAGLLEKKVQMSGIDTLICNEYEYDTYNRCTKIIVSSGGEVITRIEWEFHKDTDLIEKETHFSNGYIMRIEKYKYNSKNLVVKETVIDYRIFSNMPAPKKVVYTIKYTFY